MHAGRVVAPMEFSCIHCGKRFSVGAEMLGQSGRCPHCAQVVHLPAGEALPDEKPHLPPAPTGWLSGSISFGTSVLLHMLLFLVLALIVYERRGGEGMGEEVQIGHLPVEVLEERPEEQLAADEATPHDARESALDMELEIASPAAVTASETLHADLTLAPAAPSGGASGFDLGAVPMGGGDLGGGSWDGMIRTLRRTGLDIVIAFDSTGSMGGEIHEVKAQIRSIGATLLQLVPNTRISVCTYRDYGDEYVVKGLPLTNNLAEIEAYLAPISAGGGGDHPEAVHEGLSWAVSQNQFRPQARKVILLFGDAPPHQQYLQTCLTIASDFHRRQGGVVSTVTCRNRQRMPEFIAIAEAGGGEAFLTSDRRQIMTQLMVLVFGSQHRDKVLEAFRLMGD